MRRLYCAVFGHLWRHRSGARSSCARCGHWEGMWP